MPRTDRSGITSTFAELRAFACAAIPDLLREAGGELDKKQMVEEVERRFAGLRQWPEDLDRINAAGVRAGRNAIAWAMRDLVLAGVIRRSAGLRRLWQTAGCKVYIT